MKRWIITDTHFYHKNVITYENRPENYNELIINNCRAMISDNDELYHLGDVIFSRKGELENIMSKIPGKKFLTLGNHDRDKKPQWFKNKGFHIVSNYFIINNIMLSHYPIDIKNYDGVEYMIHGHFHGKTRKELENVTMFYPFYKFDKYFNLSIEEMEYKPILLEDFLTLKLNETIY